MKKRSVNPNIFETGAILAGVGVTNIGLGLYSIVLGDTLGTVAGLTTGAGSLAAGGYFLKKSFSGGNICEPFGILDDHEIRGK
ncbi:MAG: hypothetical protein FWE31_00905 [Firmicutes bacterium]|nr:hypothetical protein [Bacillota bacterium]